MRYPWEWLGRSGVAIEGRKDVGGKQGFLHTLIVALGLLVGPAQAASVEWDANGGSAGAQDGGGVWDTGTPNWWDGGANVTISV